MVMYNLQVLCLDLFVEEILNHQPFQAQIPASQPVLAETPPVQTSSKKTQVKNRQPQQVAQPELSSHHQRANSSDPNRAVSAPPNDPADWPPVLTDFMRTELVRRGPLKDKSRRG